MNVHPVLLAGLLLGSDGEPGFVPPAPGTYALQRILRAPEGAVLEADGKPGRFSRFTTGKVTLLSLIYTRCRDGSGCPLASFVLQRLKNRLDKDATLPRRLRFVSLSFDPDNDTPEVMRAYRDRHVSGGGGLPWFFLTTRSQGELRPLLRGLGQDVWTASGDPSAPRGSLPHLLKVFLLDRQGSVREIYTTSFLQPDVVVNDIKTLLLEEEAIRD